jgi:hypothetical protein
MISSIIATAFRKHDVAIVSEPEEVKPGIERMVLHYNNRNIEVLVILKNNVDISGVNPDSLIINLTDSRINGRVVSNEKLDVLLSRVGINTSVLKKLAKYNVVSIVPGKSPLVYAKKAMGDQRLVLTFILPLMYPYLIYDVSYERIKKGLFSKKRVRFAGKTIIDLLSLSYCFFGRLGLACDEYIRELPSSDEEYKIINELKEKETSIYTPEGLAKEMKIPINVTEDMLTKLENIGFTIRRGQRAFYITRIYPPPTRADLLLSKASRGPIPIEWAYLPFMCIRDLHERIDGVKKFLERIGVKVNGEPVMLLYPYLVMGVNEHGRKRIYVYDIMKKMFDERVVDVIKTMKMSDCLYILSKS